MVDLAVQHGVGLMLSGHTHNGQIFPFGLLVSLSYPYRYGLYRALQRDLRDSGTGQWGRR